MIDETSLTQAQCALVSALSFVLLDDARKTTLLEGALRSAKRTELPSAPDELLEFAEAHLRPQLADEVGLHLVDAFIDDLSTTLRKVDVATIRHTPEDSRSRKWPAPQPSGPVVPTDAPRPQIGIDEIVAKRSSQGLRGSVVPLVRTASKTLRAAIRAAKESVRPRSGRRASVLLVHRDCVVRASFARALVNARLDVSVYDSRRRLLRTARTPTLPSSTCRMWRSSRCCGHSLQPSQGYGSSH
jgi:hypothetical protein